MLRELFSAISEQAVNAAKGPPRQIEVYDPTKSCWLIGGEVVTVDCGCPPVEIHADTIVDFARLLDDKRASEVYIEHRNSGIVVTGLLDERNRSRVLFAVEWHPLFELVMDLGAKMLEQRQVVRLLAQDLCGCVSPNLLSALRSVDFTGSETRQLPAVGRERGTREFAVQAAGELPEVFPINVPVLAEPGIANGLATIQVGLDISLPPAAPGFLLRPLPGQIETAVIGTCNLIKLNLQERGEGDWSRAVYCGKPTVAP